MLEKNSLCKKKKILEILMCLRLKSDLSITVCSWLSFLKQASCLMVGEFSCHSMLTTLPYIPLNKINEIKVVKVILELFKLDKHSWNIEENLFLTYIYVYKSYMGPS